MAGPHHGHGAHAAGQGRLLAAIALGGLVSAAEAAGGILSGSLALLADAGHVLTDIVGLTAAYLAGHWAHRPPRGRFTYGLLRLEPLAALANGLLLGCVAASVLVVAALRVGQAPAIEHRVVLSAACFGLAANTAGAVLLGGHARGNLNLRGAFLHLLADALGALGVIVAAVVMGITGWTGADQIASLVVALVVGIAAVRLIAQSVGVLMQAAPTSAVLAEVADLLADADGVAVAGLRVWTLGGADLVVTARLLVAAEPAAALAAAHQRLQARWPGAQVTLEPGPQPPCPASPRLSGPAPRPLPGSLG